MRDDFVALILTHGRPDRVRTYEQLRRRGYHGAIRLVVDDEDRTLPEYRVRYGDEVVTFSKAAIAAQFDEADNFRDRRAIFYARNAAWGIARDLGFRYFIQLDDDYREFKYRRGTSLTADESANTIRTTLGALFAALVDFVAAVPCRTIAIAQGGDFIGGLTGPLTMKRKAMNSFVCDVERPFPFLGRVNEDVNTYVLGGIRGELFLTCMQAQLDQIQTQANAGGMTEMYLDSGTYVKSFYSVMHAPAAVRVGVLRNARTDTGHDVARLHHNIDWRRVAVQILDPKWRKHGGAFAPSRRATSARNARASGTQGEAARTARDGD